MTITDTAPKPVTPGEIDDVKFTQVVNWFTGRHGYDEVEVDAFLDRVAETIARQQREIQALGSRVERTVRQYCTCGHGAGQHNGWRDGVPAGSCLGHHMSGGPSGIRQQCGCREFTAAQR